MTTARTLTALISMFIFFLSIPLFVLVNSYVVRLIIFFVGAVGLFHMLLALWDGITKKIARSSDYIYFLTVVIGVAMAAIAHQDRRDRSVVNLINLSIEDPKSIFESSLKYSERICRQGDIPFWQEITGGFGIYWLDELGPGDVLPYELTPEMCAWLGRVREIYVSLPPADVYNFVKNGFELPWYRYLTPSNMTKSDQMMSAVLAVTSELYYAGTFEDQGTGTGAVHAFMNAAVDYIWPYVLLFAVAIRITRVTADVTEWPV